MSEPIDAVFSGSRPRILCTNDDGIASPGLYAAVRAVAPFAELLVVAPKKQQTAMGRARSGSPEAVPEPWPMEIDGTRIAAYSLDVTPASCVLHVVRNLPPEKMPHLVISGINYGENLGLNVMSSGTVGAAFEAASLSIPAIAISLQTDLASHFKFTDQNWTICERHLARFSRLLLETGMPSGVCVLKIDVPENATPQTPWRLTTLSPHSRFERAVPHPSLANRYGDATVALRETEDEPAGTDIHTMAVLKEISVTPLHSDLTAQVSFPALRLWGEGPQG